MPPIPKRVTLSPEGARDLSEDQQKLIEHLAKTTNPFYRDVVGLVDRGLSINRNMRGGIVKLPVKVGSTVEGSFPIVLTLPFTGTCGSVKFVGGRRTSSSALIQTAVCVTEWEQAGADKIKIKWITGLDADCAYELRLEVFAE